MERKLYLAPSILSANFANLEADLKHVELAGCEYLHVDVMDGHFVPNITIGPIVIASLRKITNLILDVHLMIEEPRNFLSSFAEAGADILTVHSEVHTDRTDLLKTIEMIKSYGKKAGVSLNPDQPLDLDASVLDELDLILIMSVFPGFGGQAFIEAVLPKIAQARKLIGDRDILLSVDGGIKASNVQKVIQAGAQLVVAGSAIFAAPGGISNACREFEEQMSR